MFRYVAHKFLHYVSRFHANFRSMLNWFAGLRWSQFSVPTIAQCSVAASAILFISVKFMFAVMFLRRSREYLSRSCLQPQSLQTFPPWTACRLGSQNLCRRAKANPGYSNSGGRLMFLFHLLLLIIPSSHSLQSTLRGCCWICQLREDYWIHG